MCAAEAAVDAPVSWPVEDDIARNITHFRRRRVQMSFCGVFCTIAVLADCVIDGSRHRSSIYNDIQRSLASYYTRLGDKIHSVGVLRRAGHL